MDETPDPAPPADDSVYEVSDKDYYELLLDQERVLRWQAEVRAAKAELAFAERELGEATASVEFRNQDIIRVATDWGQYEVTGDFVLSRTERKIPRKKKR